jgi:hypothetical protein
MGIGSNERYSISSFISVAKLLAKYKISIMKHMIYSFSFISISLFLLILEGEKHSKLTRNIVDEA